MRYFFIATILLAVGSVFGEEAAAVATTPVALDVTAKWIGYIWAIATGLCAVLTGVAAAIKAFAPESKIAGVIDGIAHFMGAVGTTIRPSQIAPVKK